MSKRLKNFFKNVALLVLYVVGVFVIMNWQYVWKNIAYYFPKPKVSQESVPVSQGEPNRLKIGRLGIEAPIMYIDGLDEPTFQRALQDGVVHYPGTANPGEVGNVYIFGHSSDFLNKPGNYKTVFALLPKIHIGDEILISDANGQIFKYVVYNTEVVKPDQVEVLQAGLPGEKRLTLQTSYPVGTALKRFIAQAHIALP